MWSCCGIAGTFNAPIGGAFGLLCQMVFPHMPISDGVFAVVGMAAVFAGTAHAPITAIIMLFEMTNNYQLILPLMLATVVSTIISTKLNRESIYTMKLAKRGFDIMRKRHSDRLSSILVAEAIHPDNFSLSSVLSVREALNEFNQTSEWFAYVRNENGLLIGSIAKTQLFEQVELVNEHLLLVHIVSIPPGYIDSLATVGEASQKMSALGVQYLMVLDQKSTPLGIIGNSDIVKAYQTII